MSVSNEQLLQLMLADFGAGVEVSSSWQNSTGSTLQVHEARRRPTDRPTRALRFSAQSVSRQDFDVRTLMDITKTMSEKRLDLPLWSDVAKLTASVPNGGTTVTVDSTADKRFFVNQRVLLVWFDDWDASAAYGSNADRSRVRASRVETVTVSVVAATSLTLSSGVVHASGFPAGARVYPLVRCETQLESGGDLVSRRTLSMVIDAVEVSDGETLPASHAAGATPSWCTSYKSLPVLDLRDAVGSVINASRGVSSLGSIQVVGLGSVTTVYGESSLRSRDVAGFEFKTLSRSSFWQFLQFFDSRAGRTYPFWLALPEHSWAVDAVSAGGAGLEVRGDTEFIADSEWATRYDSKNLAFILKDGSVVYRKVTSAVDTGTGRFRLTLDSTVSFAVSDIARVSDLRLVRFIDDGISEAWDNPVSCQVRFQVVELKTDGNGEDDPGPPIVDDPRTGDIPRDDWTADDVCDESSGVLLPMFDYPCESCDGNRPPIRVADLDLPTEIILRFDSSKFAEDTARIGAQTLTALKAALNGKKELVYDNTFVQARTTSRHWHHLRIQGVPPLNDWTHLEPTVSRELWKKTKIYIGDDGATAYTLEIRLVAEWDTAAAGSEEGAWGGLVHAFVFCDEVNPSYVDGDVWTDGEQYWRDDPCVSGLAGGPGGSNAKNCHPQMILCGCVPTTFQAPCGGPRVEMGQYELCVQTASGAPWSNSSVDDAANNSVFGKTVGGWDRAAMMVGGDTPISELLEYICIENGPESVGGITALSCSKPGWLESTGELDAETGSAITMQACMPAQPAENSCHPKPLVQPEATAGGSISCWHSGTTPTDIGELCIPADAIATLTLRQRCRCVRTAYGSGCLVAEEDEYECGFLTRTVTLLPLECGYNYGGNQATRDYFWRLLDTDPDRVAADFEDYFDDGLQTEWTARRGTWLESGAALHITAVAVSGDLRALYQRTNEAGSAIIQDFVAEFTIEDASVDGYGFAYRGDTSGALYDGYFAECNPVAGSLEISYFTAGVQSVLASLTGLTIASGARIRVTVEGTDHGIAVAGNDAAAVSVEDCTVVPAGGYAGLGTTNTVAGQAYGECTLIDSSTTPVAIDLSLTSTGWHLEVPELSMPAYRERWCEYDPAQTEQCNGCDFDGDVDLCKATEPTALDALTGDCYLVGPGEPKDACFPSCELWDGFLCATVRFGTACSDDDVTHNVDPQSAGFDVWMVACAF